LLHTRHESRENTLKKKDQNPSIFLVTFGTYHKNKNLMIWKFFFPEIWLNQAIFFGEKILCIGRNHNFQVEIWRNPPVKEALILTIFW